MIDVCVIGHITKDVIKIYNREDELPGGTAYYSSIALKNLGLNVAVVTKIGYADKYLLDELHENSIPVFSQMNPRTTVFEHSYPGHVNHRDNRVSKVRSTATPFTIEDIPDISPVFFHIGSLTRGDVPLEVLEFLASKSTISIDVQGFLREVVDGSVRMKEWDEKYKALCHVDIIKADDIEAQILTGEHNLKRAAKAIAAYGPKEVIITLASKGSLIYSNETFYHIPACTQERIVDPTGCGDTYMAAYLYMRLRSIGTVVDFDRIGTFCAAAASLKLEKHGPFRDSPEEVEYSLEGGGEFESFNNRRWNRQQTADRS